MRRDKTPFTTRRLFNWIKYILLAYGLIGIGIYYLQDLIFFHPEVLSRHHVFPFDEPHKEINIPYSAEVNINIVEFTAGPSPKGVVLYFHGNRKNIGWYAQYASNFTKNGYEVWMIDYPGYGKSTGKLTEERLYIYAEELYKLASAKFFPDQIVVYGKSMGSGIAAYLASEKKCRQLILETPYFSFTSLAAHYLPIYPVSNIIHYKIPSYEYVSRVRAPILIVHGDEDGVIPISNAKQLIGYLKPGDYFMTIRGGTHNDLNSFPEFQKALDSALLRPK